MSPCQILWNSIKWLLRKTRLSKKVEMVKKSSIRNFLFNCACTAFSWVLTAMAKIQQNSWIFASWNFLMYYSDKRLKPSTAVLLQGVKNIWNRYKTNKLSLYWCHVCFLLTLPRTSTSTRKKELCSATLNIACLLVKFESCSWVSSHVSHKWSRKYSGGK